MAVMKEQFDIVRQKEIYQGQFLPKDHIEHMDTRFAQVATSAQYSYKKLEFEELKYRLLAFLVVAEAKLKAWTVKYGRQAEVEALLADYMVRYECWLHSSTLLNSMSSLDKKKKF